MASAGGLVGLADMSVLIGACCGLVVGISAAFVLRRDIRKAHVDVRFNARVAADCWRLIDSIENGDIDIEPPVTSAPPPSTTPGANRRKRKSYAYDKPPLARTSLPPQRTRGAKPY